MVKRLSGTNQNTQPLVNVPTPVNPNDAANKDYVDTFAPENGMVHGEVPAGAIDSNNATFTATNAYVPNSLTVYVEGIRQRPGVDYGETAPGSGIFTFVEAPQYGYTVVIDYLRNSAAGTTDADTLDGYHASTFLDQLRTGLIPANEVWTYASWNATTRIAVFNVPSGATSRYSAGMRVKWSQATPGAVWGIIQSVTSTTITVFVQSGKTVPNETISLNFYSMVKNPYGWPAEESNWWLEFTSATDYSIAATGNTWYKLNAALQLQIPAGSWRLYYQVTPYAQAGANRGALKVNAALSTSTTGVSDQELWAAHYYEDNVANIKKISAAHIQRSKPVTLAATTTYHLIVMQQYDGTLDIRANNDPDTVIRAINGYL